MSAPCCRGDSDHGRGSTCLVSAPQGLSLATTSPRTGAAGDRTHATPTHGAESPRAWRVVASAAGRVVASASRRSASVAGERGDRSLGLGRARGSAPAQKAPLELLLLLAP